MGTSITAPSPDQWLIPFHETMAALLRVKESVRRQTGILGVAAGLWSASGDLKQLNRKLKPFSEIPDGVMSEEMIRGQIVQLRKLLDCIEDVIDTARQRQLFNRSLTSAPLGSIRIRGEYIADFLDSLEMSLDPAVLRAINEGQAQIARGEFETMEQLF